MTTTTKDTPYFPSNRDETDVAYQRGWDDAKIQTPERPPIMNPYLKETLASAYLAGFDAYLAKQNT